MAGLRRLSDASIRNAIRLLHPGPEGFSGFLLQILDHGDGAAGRRQGEFLVQPTVVEARRRSILARGGIVDPLQPSPVDGGKAHRAGLGTGVDLAARQREGVQVGTSIPDGDDLGVGSRVVGGGHSVPPTPDDLAVLDDHGRERAALPGFHLLQRKADGVPAKKFDSFVPTLASMMQSYKIDDEFASGYIARGMARVMEMQRQTAELVARNAQEIHSMMQAAYEERQRSMDYIDTVMQHPGYVGGATGITMERWSLGIAATWYSIMPPLWLYGIDGGVWFCRRSDFQEIGGYNETVPLGEDVEFLRRLKRLGAGRRPKQKLATRFTAGKMGIPPAVS